MGVKVWLRQISYAPERIRNKRLELAELRALRESISVQLKHDRIQASKTENRTETLTIKILDLEKELKESIGAFLEERQRAIQLIESLEDPEQVEVLTLRYIQAKGWTEIQEITHASKSKVFRLHREGLRELGTIWH